MSGVSMNPVGIGVRVGVLVLVGVGVIVGVLVPVEVLVGGSWVGLAVGEDVSVVVGWMIRSVAFCSGSTRSESEAVQDTIDRTTTARMIARTIDRRNRMVCAIIIHSWS